MLYFSKYHGTGNDFILIDNRDNAFQASNYRLIARLCERHYGIGADGLMLIQNCNQSSFELLYFNSDGKLGSLCGNGSRCAVKAAMDWGIINQNEISFLAADGLHFAQFDSKTQLVRLAMLPVEPPKSMDIGWFVDSGSPHWVIPVEDLSAFDVNTKGVYYRNHEAVMPNGANINFFEILNSKLSIRTFERGVEAETQSCGTGNVALAVLMAHQQNVEASKNKIYYIQNSGGELQVEITKLPNNTYLPYLKGPAELVFEGKIKI